MPTLAGLGMFQTVTSVKRGEPLFTTLSKKPGVSVRVLMP